MMNTPSDGAHYIGPIELLLYPTTLFTAVTLLCSKNPILSAGVFNALTIDVFLAPSSLCSQKQRPSLKTLPPFFGFVHYNFKNLTSRCLNQFLNFTEAFIQKVLWL